MHAPNCFIPLLTSLGAGRSLPLDLHWLGSTIDPFLSRYRIMFTHSVGEARGHSLIPALVILRVFGSLGNLERYEHLMNTLMF